MRCIEDVQEAAKCFKAAKLESVSAMAGGAAEKQQEVHVAISGEISTPRRPRNNGARYISRSLALQDIHSPYKAVRWI